MIFNISLSPSCLYSFSLTLIDALDTLLVRSDSFMLFFYLLLFQYNLTKRQLPLLGVTQSCCCYNETLVNVFLKVLGNHTEFQRVASLLQDTVDFDIDVNASVFETNIRGTEEGD